MNQNKYQYGFAERSQGAMHDEQHRRRKAETMQLVIEDCAGSLAGKSVLDVGASTGIISSFLGKTAGHVVGIDIDEPAITYAKRNNASSNVKFQVADALNMPFDEASFDLVICAQIYEHMPDCWRLMDEIFRVLKPGGYCYFAAGNRIMWMEPHYQLPLLSIVPKSIAHRYIRWTGKADTYYETHLTYWGLCKLTRSFERIDYTRHLINAPRHFATEYMVPPGSMKQSLARILTRFAYPLVPGYIWMLRKPSESHETF